jgi:uncharacterized membrane protein
VILVVRGYMSRMTRRPVVVAAWLWAIVAVLWAGQLSYGVVRFLGPDVVVGALVLAAVAVAAVRLRRRGLPVRARTVTDEASMGS